MANVDDRVVEMKFDNAAFEQKVETTLQSLDSLSKKIDGLSKTSGLANLQAASQNFSLSSMNNAVDQLANKFSTMSIIAISALNNLVSRAVDAGVALAKSLSVAPIADGFQEYETNIKSIQTILSNTKADGTNIQQVNDALDQLNTYSDKTIYNFGEMARNIGTFTAAGVDLDTSVQSIKGIANLAALSGSSSEQASSAMYQLSQAIAQGSVRLMDWNSVVNAGMGGELFQKALFETGKALGTIKNIDLGTTFEEWTKGGNTFRTSLDGTGKAVDSEATKAADAVKLANQQVADAEERAADQIESAAERVQQAQENVAETAQNSAETIANAQKARTEAAERSAERIADAEQNQSDVFEQTAENVANSVEAQKRAVEESSKDIEKSLDNVIKAQERLKKAMEPPSDDAKQAAEDRLQTAQLDKADLARAITEAQVEQKRAAEDLYKAQSKLTLVRKDKNSKPGDVASAERAVQDAQRKVVDLADAVTRAKLRQNAADRELNKAQEDLNKVNEKGTELDQDVIDAKKDVADAEQNVIDVQEEATKRLTKASEDVAKAEEDSSERRKKAVEQVADAKAEAADSDIKASKAVADAVEDSAKRQQQAMKQLEDAQKSQAKVARDTARDLEKARESAAKSIEAAAAAGGPPSWLTSDVLTTTLKGFTGDLTKEQLMALGYTEDQAAQFLELGNSGVDAASKVKTFTQLLSTLKETVGSGWSASFRKIFGDFDEATNLFSTLSERFSGIANSSADARNAVLDVWRSFGGRDILIQGITAAFDALQAIVSTVKEAFHEIFPPITGATLAELTIKFRDFMVALKPSPETLEKIKTIFKGIFAALEIGYEIVKGVAGVFVDLFKSFSNSNSGAISDFLVKVANWVINLNDTLVKGGAIKRFFDDLGPSLAKFVGKIAGWITDFTSFRDIISDISNFFKELFGSSESLVDVGKNTDNLEGRFSRFTETAKRLGAAWEWVADKFNAVRHALSGFADFMGEQFDKVKNGIANLFNKGDFDKSLDLLNVGFLGAITGLLAKFVSNGFKFEFAGGFFTNINRSIEQLTKTFQAMQTNLKADALLKIGAAIALVTASVLVLSLIDSGALTKALVGLAVGLGQLVGALALLNQISATGKDAAKLVALSGSLILIAGAVFILALAAKSMSGLGWEEIAKGLTAVTGLLIVMVTAISNLTESSGKFIRASLGMIGISIAMIILAKATKSFGEMSWDEITRGLAALSGALLAIGLAINAMPKGMVKIGLGLLGISVSLVIVAYALKKFGEMDLDTAQQGMIGIAASLLVIGLAMKLMPKNMVFIGAGLLLVSIGLIAIGGALAIIGSLSWKTLAKGILGVAVTLAVLAVAMSVMSGSVLGAVALLIVSAALVVLAGAIALFSAIGFGELAKGLAVIVISLIALGATSFLLAPLIPVMLGVGLALALMGAGFALFGVGAAAVAKAFVLIADVGKAGIDVIIYALEALIVKIPGIVIALAKSLIDFALVIIKAIPTIIVALKDLLVAFFQLIIDVLPQALEAFIALVKTLITAIIKVAPEIIAAGFKLLMDFLSGVKNNIVQITTTVSEIIVAFVTALAGKADDLIASGVTLMIAFLKGLKSYIVKIIAAGSDIAVAILEGIASYLDDAITAGVDIVVAFIKGVSKAMSRITKAAVTLITTFFDELDDAIIDIVDAGFEFVLAFLKGLTDSITKYTPRLQDAGKKLAIAILDGMTFGLSSRASGLIGSATGLAGRMVSGIAGVFGIRSPSKVMFGFGQNIVEGLANGISQDAMALRSTTNFGNRINERFNSAINDVASSLTGMDNFNPTITPVLDLTNVEREAGRLGGIFGASPIGAQVSYDQASSLSVANAAVADDISTVPLPVITKEIQYIQNNYSPEALSTVDIYRQTRSQIKLAKEELSVP